MSSLTSCMQQGALHASCGLLITARVEICTCQMLNSSSLRISGESASVFLMRYYLFVILLLLLVLQKKKQGQDE